ncbi:MAG: lysophospholipid acyltransferase family protein [Alphaproteobacteria bacterium]
MGLGSFAPGAVSRHANPRYSRIDDARSPSPMLKRLIRHPAAQALLAWLIGLYLRLIWATTRWQLEGAEYAKVSRGQPLILAFWHECLPLAAQGWRLMGGHIPVLAGLRAQALISRHRDGRLIARAVAPFDVEVVHASSSKGGAAGLRQLLRVLEGGGVAVITPDGPRGPARQAAPGIAQLAALAGLPVLACGAASSRMRRARSWDRMRFPLPFARAVVMIEAPITVPREDPGSALPAITAALNRATERADQAVAR